MRSSWLFFLCLGAGLALASSLAVPTSAEQVSPQSAEVISPDIPPILNSSLHRTGPTFVSAGVAIDASGELNATVLDEDSLRRLGTHLDNYRRGALERTDCVPYGPVWVSRVNPVDRSSLRAAARTSQLVLEGTVVGRDYGFYEGDIPGQLLKVATERVMRGDSQLDWYYVFYPVGEFEAGPYTFCKTDDRYPAPPEIGDRVLLLVPEPGEPGEPFLPVEAAESIVVLGKSGEARLPKSFGEGEERRWSRSKVLSEVRAAVGEQ